MHTRAALDDAVDDIAGPRRPMPTRSSSSAGTSAAAARLAASLPVENRSRVYTAREMPRLSAHARAAARLGPGLHHQRGVRGSRDVRCAGCDAAELRHSLALFIYDDAPIGVKSNIGSQPSDRQLLCRAPTVVNRRAILAVISLA